MMHFYFFARSPFLRPCTVRCVPEVSCALRQRNNKVLQCANESYELMHFYFFAHSPFLGSCTAVRPKSIACALRQTK